MHRLCKIEPFVIHLLSYFLPASDIPVLKEVEALTEPAVFNMVRFVVAAIPFVPFAVRAFGDRRVRYAGLELGVWVSLGYLSQAIGLLSSDAGRASFITAITVDPVSRPVRSEFWWFC